PRPAPLTPQQPNHAAPLISGAENAAPGVDVQKLLSGHHALKLAHDALQRDYAERGRGIETLTSERDDARRQVHAHEETIQTLTREKGQALELAQQRQGTIDTLTHEKGQALELAQQRQSTIDTLTHEKGQALELAQQRQQIILELTQQKDAATELAEQRQQAIQILTQQKTAVEQRFAILSDELGSLRERYTELYSGVEKVSAENTALNKKAVWRESEIERLTSQLDSLQRRYDYLASGIKEKDANFKAETERLESQIASTKSTLAEMQDQQEASARRIQELTKEKSTVESQSREDLSSLTSQRDAAESRASEALGTIQFLTSARDVAVARAEQAERANSTLQRATDAAVSTASQAQLTIGHLRSQKESAEAAAAELRPALTLAQQEVTILTEKNQLALQQLAEKTNAAAAAQKTIELQEAELRALRDQSTTTSQRVDEQAARILQQEQALVENGSMIQQLASRNQELTSQNALLQSQMENSPFHLLDGSRSASVDPSALELEELKERFSRVEAERLETMEAQSRQILELSQGIRALQSALAEQTEKTEESEHERAALAKELEKQTKAVAALREKLRAQTETNFASNEQEVFRLEYELQKKKDHVALLQHKLSSKEAEMEHNFKERTQAMQEELERLLAAKKQLTTGNQQMSKKLEAQVKEIRELSEWGEDQAQHLTQLHGASIKNRILSENLAERTGQLSSAEQQISQLTAKVAKLTEYLEAGMAEITKLRRAQEENASDEVPVLLDKIAEQEQLLQQAGTIGKALLERNQFLEEENAAVREELAILLQVKSDFRDSMSRLGAHLETSKQMAEALGNKHRSTTTNSTESTDE
ncbi:MAG TPA: hypothetical protein VIJ14_03515, partial [Rhabdochlamydiaceae bacterium]